MNNYLIISQILTRVNNAMAWINERKLISGGDGENTTYFDTCFNSRGLKIV